MPPLALVLMTYTIHVKEAHQRALKLFQNTNQSLHTTAFMLFTVSYKGRRKLQV